MEPLSIAIILAGIALLGAVVTIAYLYWDDIVEWFQDRNAVRLKDKDNIAFTIQQRIADNKFSLVQGIFNTRTNTVVDGREIHAEKLDTRIRAVHQNEELAIYQ